jgi:spore maturation protein CgeB
MKIVVFGLAVSSSWGNGHATLWRGLIRALATLGNRVVFFEHDAPWYATSRDLHDIPGGDLVVYPDWPQVAGRARRELADADVAIVTSFCPHGVEATDLVMEAGRPIRLFYDLDTPVTLSLLEDGEDVTSIGERGLGCFDLVLSYTGGTALDALRTRLGARRVAPLYGHVDPELYRPVEPDPRFRCDLSYIGTFAPDRQEALEALFVEPARRRPAQRFVLAGAQYPRSFPWTENIHFVRHLPPAEHSPFYAASRLTLNVTRAAMARSGWCPSGRLFEAAACGTAILTDTWRGLDEFFEPGREILIARSTQEALDALDMSPEAIATLGRRGRERVLDAHTSMHRARELLALIAGVRPERSGAAPEMAEA